MKKAFVRVNSHNGILASRALTAPMDAMKLPTVGFTAQQ